MSDVSPALRAAYLGTHYQVRHPKQPFTLRISQHSPELARLHRLHGVACSAFLTAWNPFSQPVSAEDNRRAQAALLRDLGDARVNCVPGAGIDPDAGWGEDSILALGLERDAAIRLGRHYRQNAVVWSGADATPQLIVLE